MVFRSLCTATLTAVFLAAPAFGQEYGRLGDIQYSGTSYHIFARPGEATVQVIVMGAGGGIYEIGENTRLDELFALVGGGGQVDLSERPSALTSVRLYRNQSAQRSLVYDASIEEMLTYPGAYPTLRDGDVFVIESKPIQRFGWRDGLSILTGVSALLLVSERILRRF